LGRPIFVHGSEAWELPSTAGTRSPTTASSETGAGGIRNDSVIRSGRYQEDLRGNAATEGKPRPADGNLDGTASLPRTQRDLGTAGNTQILKLSAGRSTAAYHADAILNTPNGARKGNGTSPEQVGNERDLVRQGYDVLKTTRLPMGPFRLHSQKPQEALGDLVATIDPFPGSQPRPFQDNLSFFDLDISTLDEIEHGRRNIDTGKIPIVPEGFKGY
jgi:hypothetical protein